MVHRRTIVRRSIWIILLFLTFLFLLLDRTVRAEGTVSANTASKLQPSESNSPVPNNDLSVNNNSAADALETTGGQARGLVRRANPAAADTESTVVAPLSQSPPFWRSFFSLSVVLVLIVLAAYLFRRFALDSPRSRGSAAIEILARSAISPKQSLCLVKLGNRLLLLGLSPNHMAGLLALEDPEEIAPIMGLLEKHAPNSITNTFNRVLHREGQDYNCRQEGPYNEDQEEDEQIYDEEPQRRQQWNRARSELSSLLKKVKGLSRMRLHS